MSEQDTTTEAAPDQDVTEDTGTEETEAPEATEDDGPDWRKDFDPDKAAERIRKIQSENKNLRDRAKQAEEKAKGADEKDTRITALEAENLRYQVGYDLGLPRELVDRLKGSSRDEMLADAEALLKLVRAPATTRKPIEALRGGGEPEQEPEERDLDKIGSRMFRR